MTCMHIEAMNSCSNRCTFHCLFIHRSDGNVEFQLSHIFLYGLLNFNQLLTRSKVLRMVNVGNCRVVQLTVFMSECCVNHECDKGISKTTKEEATKKALSELFYILFIILFFS